MDYPTRPPTEVELSYLAGLIDGEGCIRLNYYPNSSKSPYASCQVSMTDAGPLKLLNSLFPNRSGRLGYFIRPNSRYKNVYRWQSYSRKTHTFLKLIFSYLRNDSKIADARKVFDLYEQMPTKIFEYRESIKTGKTYTCTQCGHTFYKAAWRVIDKSRYYGDFCTYHCWTEYRRTHEVKRRIKTGKTVNCNFCGREHYRPLHRVKWKSTFCSRQCHMSSMTNGSQSIVT